MPRRTIEQWSDGELDKAIHNAFTVVGRDVFFAICAGVDAYQERRRRIKERRQNRIDAIDNAWAQRELELDMMWGDD